MSGLAYFLLSGFSAWALCRRAAATGNFPIRALSILVCWALLQLLPVHVIAALQILGVLSRVDVRQLLWIQILILSAAAAWNLRRAAPPFSLHRPHLEPLPKSRILVASAIVIVTLYAVGASELLMFYPSGSDALRYHLPLAVRWLQEGSLRIPASGTWQCSLPSNAEIGMMVLLSSGYQSLAPLVNWFALTVCALASYVIAKHLSKNTTAATTASLIIFTLPPLYFQTFSCYVDLYATAFLLTAIALFLSRNTSHAADVPGSTAQPSRAVLFLSSVACGISIGAKPIYYFYGGIYLLGVLVVLLKQRHSYRRSIAKSILLITAGVLLPSAFWFARAFYTTGNPVYPLEVKIANRVVLAGIPPGEITKEEYEDEFVRSKAEWPLYPWTEWKKTIGFLRIPYGTSMGFGAAFATFVPIGFVLLILHLFVQIKRAPLAARLLLPAWFVGLFGWWFLMHRVLRFGMPLWVLACCFSAPMFASLRGSRLRAVHILFLCATLSTGALVAVQPLHSLLGRLPAEGRSRSAYYSYPRVIDELPRGSRIVNLTKRLDNFCLAGENLSNRVIADFEVPLPLTIEYLKRERVNFVVDRPGYSATSLSPPPCEGLTLLYSEAPDLGSNQKGKIWRIWRVPPGA